MNIINTSDNFVKAMITTKHFLKSSNPFKFIVLWTQKIYRFINYVMRDIVPEKIVDYPYCLYFIKSFINSFEEYGKSIVEINKFHYKYYRGISIDFKDSYITKVHNMHYNYKEESFMATSIDKHVALRFSGKEGFLIKLNTKRCKDDFKVLVIDKSVVKNSSNDEKEVLFLPGEVSIHKIKNNTMFGTYKTNISKVNMLKNLDMPQIGGGVADIISLIPDIDITNKHIIWYRASFNRLPKIDILKKRKLPCNKAFHKIIMYYNTYLKPIDYELEQMTDMIPDVIDLRNNNEDFFKIMSYYPIQAVYDIKENKVLTISYGIIDGLFQELFPYAFKNTNIIENAILKDMQFWYDLQNNIGS